jgi:SPP1 gp7 family putative phage head morphogenesis protein
VRKLGDALQADDELAAALFRANLQTNLAGQLFVRDVERRRLTTLAADTGIPFLDLPFDEAIAHFLDRGMLPREEFERLSDLERFRAFSMARVSGERMMQRALELLQESMVSGDIGLREFARQVRDGEAELGFTLESPHYLENVYRTATATSYNAGRLRQQTDADVLEAGGVWEYVTAGDDRVRSSHWPLHGKQWAVGDPDALSVYPPNGYQCRCVIVLVDDEDADPAALSRTVDLGRVSTEGVRGPPDEVIAVEGAGY